MPDFSEISDRFQTVDALEKKLQLKQLQINRLLTITQAINNNFPAEQLYELYQSTLIQELSVRKMALFVNQDEKWTCVSHAGVLKADQLHELPAFFTQFMRILNLEGIEHPLVHEFDIVVPVLHKDFPLAYVFIGGFSENEDMFNKVQFITAITNVVAVAIENKRLFKKQLEQERMRQEMDLAKEVQRLLIPKSLPKKKHYGFSSIYMPHYSVGGDYFDFIEFADNRIVFCIADVSGKGLAAALLMANFQANFHTLIHKKKSIKAFVKDLNTAIFRTTGGDRYLTFFMAEYNIDTKELTYVNAGHFPPVLCQGNTIHHLNVGCTLLGSFGSLKKISIGRLVLEEETTILTFTDGLTDIRNAEGTFLDESLIYSFVEENQHLSATELCDALQEMVNTFKGDLPYPDDFTVLACKLFPMGRKAAHLVGKEGK